MSTRPDLIERLGIRLPILQAPMAGGATTPELVATVSNAGGLGALGAGYMQPEAIAEACRAVRRLTDKPFQVNLFVPDSGPNEGAPAADANAALAPYREELGLPEPEIPSRFTPHFARQAEAVLSADVPAFSFTFGVPDEAILRAFREKGVTVMGTATTLAEALTLEDTGLVDVVVAQGMEAGGHRGTFLVDYGQGLVGLLPLLQELRAKLRLPVVAAGGIMTGQGIAATMKAGAAAAQLGTAFLTCDECSIPEVYKRTLETGRDDGTALTRAFSGKPARGLRNRFIAEMAEANPPIAPYPVQNTLTKDIRAAAARQGRPEFLSLWAGQGVALCRRLPAVELMAALEREMAAG